MRAFERDGVELQNLNPKIQSPFLHLYLITSWIFSKICLMRKMRERGFKSCQLIIKLMLLKNYKNFSTKYVFWNVQKFFFVLNIIASIADYRPPPSKKNRSIQEITNIYKILNDISEWYSITKQIHQTISMCVSIQLVNKESTNINY